MIKRIVITSSIIIGVLLLQTTVIDYIAISGVKPDIAFILLILFSLRQGSWVGQVSGFITGIVEDILSLSPLGFHSFIKTLTGYIYGFFKGKVYLDPIFFPILFVFTGTLVKGIFIVTLIVIFRLDISVFSFFSWQFWLELLYNILLTPFLFFIITRIEKINEKRRSTLS